MRRGSKADELLSLLFMVMAVASGVCYFAFGPKVFFIVGGIAVLMRIVHYILRFF
ncbi:MAG: hypothetical protein LBD21_02130 [Tannerellaceae bacterium]|jgi:hypothetical protein|nr:hypothetical protein [Tannerellaceae bacterium]